MLNYAKFNARGRKGVLDDDVIQSVDIVKGVKISLSKRGGEEEEE